MNAQATPAFARTATATCAVRLVDRRTGAPHRVNGTPLVVFTRNPAEAVAELLSGRDPKVWEARIDRLEAGATKGGVR